MSGAPKIPRSIRYWMSTPRASLTVGMSFHSASLIRAASNTASGRTRPAFQWLTHSMGLFTVQSTCLPTRLTQTSPPPLNGTYVNFTPSACSSWMVMIWSSWAEPVPPIFMRASPPDFSLTAATYSLAVLYDVSALTQRMNSSRARRAIGVMSRQLKGTPVCSGVVNRFDSVMIIVWVSPFLPFTCRKPSAPAPPDLLTTMIGRGESLCFSAMPAMRRAIWSAPPPVPAGITNSMGFVGSQAAWAPPAPATTRNAANSEQPRRGIFFMVRVLLVSQRVQKTTAGPGTLGRPAPPMVTVTRYRAPPNLLRAESSLRGVEPPERDDGR